MSDHEQKGEAHAHPTGKVYVGIAVILTIVTAVEVAVFYIPAMSAALVPILLVLSAGKFAMVAMWYMHLKFDHRLFSWLFFLPMLLAVFLIAALMKLFGQW